MAKAEVRNFDSPDDVMHAVAKIKMDIVKLDGQVFQRITATPGWKWSVDLKPVVKTDSCQIDHLLYVISGKMKVQMDDGQMFDYAPGDIGRIPPGHDGWGIGDEPTIWLEIPH